MAVIIKMLTATELFIWRHCCC